MAASDPKQQSMAEEYRRPGQAKNVERRTIDVADRLRYWSRPARRLVLRRRVEAYVIEAADGIQHGRDGARRNSVCLKLLDLRVAKAALAGCNGQKGVGPGIKEGGRRMLKHAAKPKSTMAQGKVGADASSPAEFNITTSIVKLQATQRLDSMNKKSIRC